MAHTSCAPNSGPGWTASRCRAGRRARRCRAEVVAGLAVAGLALPDRTVADQPAGPLPWLQPVAEVRLGDLLQQPDIGLEVRQHRLPLLPGQRLAGSGAALQHPFQRAGQCRAGGTRQVPARRRGRPDHRGHGPVAQRLVRVRGHVLPGHLGDDALLDPQEPADLVQRPHRRVNQVTVAQDEHLLLREHLVQVLELLAVPAQPRVVPELRPARRHPAVLVAAGPDEIPDRVKAGRPEVGPVGVGPLHRVTQHRDHLDVRDQVLDPALRRSVIEVERGGLGPQLARRGRLEQRLVVLPPPDLLTPGRDIAGAAATGGRRPPVGQEVLGLFDRRHVEHGMRGQGRVQGRGAGFGGTDDQEVRQRHGASFT